MGLFDILANPQVRSVLTSLAGQAQETLQTLGQKASSQGNLGSLAGAGALGALLGSVLPKGLSGAAGMLGVGVVAWNYYRKWASEQGITTNAFVDTQKQQGSAGTLDPVALQLLRAMIYAARADGHVDETEQKRIDQIAPKLFPNQDVTPIVQKFMTEPIDPAIFAQSIKSAEQAEDLYRLSCVIVDVDHFMEKSYCAGLAQALHIDDERANALQNEAKAVKEQLANFA